VKCFWKNRPVSLKRLWSENCFCVFIKYIGWNTWFNERFFRCGFNKQRQQQACEDSHEITEHKHIISLSFFIKFLSFSNPCSLKQPEDSLYSLHWKRSRFTGVQNSANESFTRCGNNKRRQWLTNSGVDGIKCKHEITANKRIISLPFFSEFLNYSNPLGLKTIWRFIINIMYSEANAVCLGKLLFWGLKWNSIYFQNIVAKHVTEIYPGGNYLVSYFISNFYMPVFFYTCLDFVKEVPIVCRLSRIVSNLQIKSRESFHLNLYFICNRKITFRAWINITLRGTSHKLAQFS